MIETAVVGTNKADIAPVTTPVLKLLTGNFLNTTQVQMTISNFHNPGGNPSRVSSREKFNFSLILRSRLVFVRTQIGFQKGKPQKNENGTPKKNSKVSF